MSEKTLIGKRKDTYRSAVKNLKTEHNLQAQFRKLNSVIPPRKRRGGLTMEELKAMEKAYSDTINMISQKMNSIEEDYPDIEAAKKMNSRRRDSRGKSTEKKRFDLYDYISKLRKTLSKDLKAINACIRMDHHPTVAELYENSRSEKIEIDTSKSARFGGNLSSRLRIQTNGKDGFFTESKKGIPAEDMLNEAFKENKKLYGNQSLLEDNPDRHFNSQDVLNMVNIVLKDRDLKRALLGKSDNYMRVAYDATERRMVMDKMVLAIKDRSKLKSKNKDAISRGEANRYCDILGAINSPEEYMSLIDIMHKGASIMNIDAINSAVGINATSKADKRNSAMSMVADLIGCKNVLANSVNLHVKNPVTGKIAMGTFMEKAEGVDYNSIDPSDLEKFNQVTPDMLENNLSLKKDIANLQIVDWLGGNPDRHMGNIFYKYDDSGKLVGLVGIDNDTSFGKGDHSRHMQGTFLENMMVIPKETADRIETMDRESLKTMLYGYDLSSREVENAIKRFDELKNKLAADKEYFKDKPHGYVETGRIKIVSDEELSEISLYGELGDKVAAERKRTVKNVQVMESQGRGSKNLFAAIAEMGVDGDGLKHSYNALNKSLNKDCANIIRENHDMEKRAEEMQRVEAATYKGSQKFRDMMDSLKTGAELVKSLNPVLMKQDNKSRISIEERNLDIISKKLQESLVLCDTYLETKNEAQIMKKSEKSNAYKRFKLAKEAKTSIEKTLKAINSMKERADLANSYIDRLNPMVVKCRKQKRAIIKTATDKKVEQMNQINQNEINNQNRPEVAPAKQM